MSVLLWAAGIVAGTFLTVVTGLATTALVRALREVARLPAVVEALSAAVDRLTALPPRVDRLEAAVFPEGVPS